MYNQCLESDLVLSRFPKLSPKQVIKLKNFYMLQRELARELLEAKSLGICKITTSIGRAGIVTKFSDEDLKETF